MSLRFLSPPPTSRRQDLVAAMDYPGEPTQAWLSSVVGAPLKWCYVRKVKTSGMSESNFYRVELCVEGESAPRKLFVKALSAAASSVTRRLFVAESAALKVLGACVASSCASRASLRLESCL